MRQELHVWRSEAGSRRWLSMLIAAMEDAAQPEVGRQSLDASALERFRAQLALPASPLLYPTTASSLRH